jgi:hypothetical protein
MTTHTFLTVEYSGDADPESGLRPGYCVEVRPVDGEPFDIVYEGLAIESGQQLLRFRDWDDELGDGVGDVRTMPAAEIRNVYVY